MTGPADRPCFRADGEGLVVDPVRNARYPIGTGGRPETRPAEPTGFRFPVGAAVAIRTSELVFPYVVPPSVRCGAGETVAGPTRIDRIGSPALVDRPGVKRVVSSTKQPLVGH